MGRFKIRSKHQNWTKKKERNVARHSCTAPILFVTTVRGSGQSLGVNTHLNSTSTHVATGKNTCFTRLLQKKEERRQPTVNHYNVTQGGVLQRRGWVGKQLSSRRTPVLTFSADLDTENTWQCHSAFQKYRLFDEAPSLPLFSSPWYLIPLSTQYGRGENHDVVLCMWRGTDSRQVTYSYSK